MKFIKIHYLAKQELLRWPFKWFFLRTGAIPVNRFQSHDVVEQVAGLFEKNDPFFLALSPEGTRAYTEKWRSGFYWIAVRAQVPIIMAYFDFQKKEAGLGEVLQPSGDYAADARKIEAYYRNRVPFRPGRWNWKVV